MQRDKRTKPPAVSSQRTAWITGYAIGTSVVAVVVALVSAILAYARSVSDACQRASRVAAGDRSWLRRRCRCRRNAEPAHLPGAAHRRTSGRGTGHAARRGNDYG